MKNYASDHNTNLGEVQEYPFAYHELFNEPEREDILENMSNWLQTHFE